MIVLYSVKHRFTVVRDANVHHLASSMWAPTLGKLGLTSRAKSAVSSPAMLEARRAGCMETCLSGSREASASKARPGSICGLYPMNPPGFQEVGRPGHAGAYGPAVVLEGVMPVGSG